MKRVAILPILFLSAVAGALAEAEPLESVKRAKWIHRDYTNPGFGISVSVRARPEKEKTGTTWGRGTFREEEVDGTTISISTQEDDNEIAEIRVPLDAATIEHLFTARNEPDYVRFIAASHITDSNLPAAEQLRLLQRGTNLPDATLRYYIWHDIGEFKPRKEVSPILHRGLCDPCIEIAHECIGVVIDEYGLKAADGKEIEWTTLWRGSLLAHYIVQHREIVEVAEALARKRADLMPPEELDAIRNRAIPSDDWFELHFGDRNPKAREYFREYAAKTMAARSGDGKATTSPGQDPEGGDNPPPESDPRTR